MSRVKFAKAKELLTEYQNNKLLLESTNSYLKASQMDEITKKDEVTSRCLELLKCNDPELYEIVIQRIVNKVGAVEVAIEFGFTTDTIEKKLRKGLRIFEKYLERFEI